MGYKPTGRNHRPQKPAPRPAVDRETYRRRKDDLAEIIANRVDHGREYDELTEQIRQLTTQLRAATTPAERRVIEAQVIPLVRRRQAIGFWLPDAS